MEDQTAFTRLITALNGGCAFIFRCFGGLFKVIGFILRKLAGEANQNRKSLEANS